MQEKLVGRFRDLAIATSGFPGYVLALDPGETTGWALFHDYRLLNAGQIPTGSVRLAYLNLYDLMLKTKTDECQIPSPAKIRDYPLSQQLHIAIEDYRVYGHKTDDHAWSSVHTIKVVGLAELCAMLQGLPFTLRMAQHAKGFATDERLKQWNMWVKGQRHARDAVRHGALYIIDYNKNGAK